MRRAGHRMRHAAAVFAALAVLGGCSLFGSSRTPPDPLPAPSGEIKPAPMWTATLGARSGIGFVPVAIGDSVWAAAQDGTVARLDADTGRFRSRLVSMLSAAPLDGVELSREVQALVEAAGKDAPPRRARLRVVLGGAVDFYRAALRHAAGTGATPGTRDEELAAAAARFGGSAEDAAEALRFSLDALDGIDRNAHLPTLVDAWTARLESLGRTAAPR